MFLSTGVLCCCRSIAPWLMKSREETRAVTARTVSPLPLAEYSAIYIIKTGATLTLSDMVGIISLYAEIKQLFEGYETILSLTAKGSREKKLKCRVLPYCIVVFI